MIEFKYKQHSRFTTLNNYTTTNDGWSELIPCIPYNELMIEEYDIRLNGKIYTTLPKNSNRVRKIYDKELAWMKLSQK